MKQPDHDITIVSGLPRSGTSLLMQMLDAGGMRLLRDGARAPDSDNPRGYYEYEAVKRTLYDASWLDAAPGCAVKVVAPLLVRLPPDRRYRVLLMRRALPQVLASQRVMLTRVGALEGGLSDPRLAEILEAQWMESEAWCRRHAQWLRVEHAELLAEPQRLAQRVNAFLGGELDASAMSARVEPALHRQRAS